MVIKLKEARVTVWCLYKEHSFWAGVATTAVTNNKIEDSQIKVFRMVEKCKMVQIIKPTSSHIRLAIHISCVPVIATTDAYQ